MALCIMRCFSTRRGLGVPVEPEVCTSTVVLSSNHSAKKSASEIDHPAMLAKFESYKDKSRLDYDLNFLYGLRERVTLQGNGPRNFIFSGDKLIIPCIYKIIFHHFIN